MIGPVSASGVHSIVTEGQISGDPKGWGCRRRVRGFTTTDRLNLMGAAASGFCVALLLFGRLAPFSGILGFVFVFAVSLWLAVANRLSPWQVAYYMMPNSVIVITVTSS